MPPDLLVNMMMLMVVAFKNRITVMMANIVMVDHRWKKTVSDNSIMTKIVMVDHRWKKKKEEEDQVHRTGSKLPSKVDLLNW